VHDRKAFLVSNAPTELCTHKRAGQKSEWSMTLVSVGQVKIRMVHLRNNAGPTPLTGICIHAKAQGLVAVGEARCMDQSLLACLEICDFGSRPA
jgi:hypothetical protein